MMQVEEEPASQHPVGWLKEPVQHVPSPGRIRGGFIHHVVERFYLMHSLKDQVSGLCITVQGDGHRKTSTCQVSRRADSS